jgi:hypothetical protein
MILWKLVRAVALVRKVGRICLPAMGRKTYPTLLAGAGFWKKTLNPSERGVYYSRVRRHYRRRHEPQDEEDQNHRTISLGIVDIRFPAPVLRLRVHRSVPRLQAGEGPALMSTTLSDSGITTA